MIINPSNKISIFSKRIEAINILFPLIVLFFAGIEIVYIGPLYKTYSDLSLLVTNVIFFNSTHVVLTFFMLYSVPTVNTWPAGLPGGSRAFWLKTAIVSGFIFCAYLALDINLGPKYSDAFFFLLMFVQLHHVLAQMRGLSYCYNQQIRRADPGISNKKIQRSEWLEKWGFFIFIGSFFSLRQVIYSTQGWPVHLAWVGLTIGASMIFGGAFY
jgi:hypothetical protein